MKSIRSLCVIIAVALSLPLVSASLGTSFALRSPKTQSEPLDYQIGIQVHLDSLMLSELEFERQDGKYYNNAEVFLWNRWKCTQQSVTWVDIQEDDIRRLSLDSRVVYRQFSLGFANTWDMHPSQNLVLGYKVQKKIGIPGLLPISIFVMSNLYTSDLLNYDNETEMKFSAKIGSVVSVYFRHKQRYYSKWLWNSKIGVEVTI